MESVFTSNGADVFRRGVLVTPDCCERLLAIFYDTKADDWFRPFAVKLAAELQAAMDEANSIERAA